MAEQKVNEETVGAVSEACREHAGVGEFLRKLIFREAEQTRQQWHYKEFYRDQIGSYSEEWKTQNETQ